MGKLDAIQRYLLIIRKIKSYRYISLEELQHEITAELVKHGSCKSGVSVRTIKRDLRDIRDELNIPLAYSRAENGYYFPETEAWSPDNIERLLEPFDILNSLNADTGLDRIVFPERRSFQGTGHLLPLIKAAGECRPVRFCYRKYSEASATIRDVFPYALRECRHRWYLLGMENNRLKTFGLDRISGLQVCPGKFRKNPSIDVEVRFKDLFGILDDADLPVEEVILSFDSRDGEYLKSLPLHPSQEILKDEPENNEIILRLHIKITRDLVMELLSRSRSLKVISPDHLKEAVCRIYQDALERNSTLGSRRKNIS